jgi:hypothetical protein
LSKRKAKINLEEALEDLFRWMNRPVTRAEWDEFTSWLNEAARIYGDKPKVVRRGRPEADYLGDDRISVSYQAAKDIFQHLQEFRRRNGPRMPNGATEAIIKEVLSYRSDNVDTDLVDEYLRENRKYFRHLIEDAEE